MMIKHKTAVRAAVLLMPFAAVSAAVLLSPAVALIGEHMPPCIIHYATGFYCPGCGMTRSFLSLAGGDVLMSLHYHPLPMLAIVLCTLLYIELLLYVFGRRVRILPRKPVFWSVAFAAFLLFLCARSFIPALWPV